MADLTELRTAVSETVERSAVPGFDDLVRRARDRSRRRAVGLAAAAVVLAGTAALLLPHGEASSGPAPAGTSTPTPTPSSTPTTAVGRLRAMTPEQIVATGHLYSYASGGSGSVLTVWQACAQGHRHCRYAWRTPHATGSTLGTLTGAVPGGAGPAVYPAGGGYVLQPENRQGLLVRADGSVSPLEPGDPPLPVDQGAVVVRDGARWNEVDPVTARAWTLAPPDGSEGVVRAQEAPDGTVWAMPGWAGPGRVEVAWRRGGVWRSHPIPDPGSDAEVPSFLAISGSRTGATRVAALSSYDGAGEAPVGVLAVSTDGGSSWVDLPGSTLPFDTVESMAASAAGVLFVAEPSGTLWRSTDGSWTSFTRVRGVRATGVQPAGEDVLAFTGSWERPGLVLVGGDGSTRTAAAR